MPKLKIRPIRWAVYYEGESPIFGESTVHVGIDDEGAGSYVTAKPLSGSNEVTIEPDQLGVMISALCVARKHCEEIADEEKKATTEISANLPVNWIPQ